MQCYTSSISQYSSGLGSVRQSLIRSRHFSRYIEFRVYTHIQIDESTSFRMQKIIMWWNANTAGWKISKKQATKFSKRAHSLSLTRSRSRSPIHCHSYMELDIDLCVLPSRTQAAYFDLFHKKYLAFNFLERFNAQIAPYSLSHWWSIQNL